MTSMRALAIGVLLALAAFAALSGDLLVAFGIGGVGVLLAGIVYVRAHRAPATSRHPLPDQHWLPWVCVGAVLCLMSLVTVAVAGDRELAPPAWLALMGVLLLGLTALGTGLVLAVQRFSRPVAIRSE